jgi:hypothetical protein
LGGGRKYILKSMKAIGRKSKIITKKGGYILTAISIHDELVNMNSSS